MEPSGEISQTGKNVSMGASAASGAAAGTAVMPGWGTAIGAGIGLIGGALSNQYNENRSEQSYSQQKEALQNSVRWRVADAKAAGIHPLYAMGMPSMNINPMIMEDRIGPAVQEMGQSMPNILRASKTPYESSMEFQQWANLQSVTDKNNAEANYYNSMATKSLQDARSNIPNNGLGIQNEMGQMPTGGGQGMIDKEAAKNVSPKAGANWLAAGQNPAMELRYMDKKLPFIGPFAQDDSFEEGISDMSNPAFMGLVLRNSHIFGKGWFRDFVNSRYLGLEPQGNYDHIVGKFKEKGYKDPRRR